LHGTEKDIWVEIFRLRATYQMPRYMIRAHKASSKSPNKALKTKREVWWNDRMEQTSIYEQRLLECGNMIDGPAIVESEDTTVALPERWRYTVDKYLNGKIEKTG
jgi:N-methylhydantoinase A/oxoprolinase/acetone carboxylase beta subunit